MQQEVIVGFFSRLFAIGKVEANAELDKLDDSISMTKQEIKDLKKDLGSLIQSLADEKLKVVRVERDMESQKQIANDYEKKAMQFLQKVKTFELDSEQANRLAASASEKKQTADNRVVSLTAEKKTHHNMIAKLKSDCSSLKFKISTYEKKLTTLEVNRKNALAANKKNQRLAKFKVVVLIILFIFLCLNVPRVITYSKKFIITERNANRCKNGDVEGCNTLINLLPFYPFRDRSVSVLKELCQKGNTDICKHVGDIYRDGIINKSNYPLSIIFKKRNITLRHALAKKYYNIACEADNLESCYNLLVLKTLKGDQNLPLHSAIPMLIRENIVFYKNLLSQYNYLEEYANISCNKSFLVDFNKNPNLSTFQNMVWCYHTSKDEIRQTLTIEEKDHLDEYYTNYRPQSLPSGNVVKIENLITNLFKQQIEILNSSNTQQHSMAFYTIHKLAHFLIDTFYTSQRPEDIQFLIEKNNISFLLPIAFNSLSTPFFEWLLKQKEENGYYLATLIPLKILLLFIDSETKSETKSETESETESET